MCHPVQVIVQVQCVNLVAIKAAVHNRALCNISHQWATSSPMATSNNLSTLTDAWALCDVRSLALIMQTIARHIVQPDVARGVYESEYTSFNEKCQRFSSTYPCCPEGAMSK